MADEQNTYDPEARYRVSVRQVVQIGAFKYRPRDLPVMTGKLLNTIVEEYGPDAVREAEPV